MGVSTSTNPCASIDVRSAAVDRGPQPQVPLHLGLAQVEVAGIAVGWFRRRRRRSASGNESLRLERTSTVAALPPPDAPSWGGPALTVPPVAPSTGLPSIRRTHSGPDLMGGFATRFHGVDATWTIPVASRRSRNTTPPWSRRLRLHRAPSRFPTSAARKVPTICDRIGQSPTRPTPIVQPRSKTALRHFYLLSRFEIFHRTATRGLIARASRRTARAVGRFPLRGHRPATVRGRHRRSSSLKPLTSNVAFTLQGRRRDR